jgi:spore coat polysaccharide biosynthesis protein SpsF (cytidylyltransferase family)
VVRVCADNPLIWPGGIDALVEVAQKDTEAEYVGYEMAPGDPAILHANGWFAEVVRVGALRRLDFMLAREHPEREHVTQGLYTRAGIFQCRWLPTPEWYGAEAPQNVSIDTPDDLRRVSDWLDDQAAVRNGSPWK